MSVLLKNKDILNGHVKEFCDFVGKENGGVIASVLQGADGLSGHAQSLGKILLKDAPFLPDRFYLIFQNIPPEKSSLPYVKLALHSQNTIGGMKCQVNFT